MIAIQLCRGDWRRVKQDMSLLRFTTILELYHAMRNIISLAPDPRDSAQIAAPTMKGLGYPGQASGHKAIRQQLCH